MNKRPKKCNTVLLIITTFLIINNSGLAQICEPFLGKTPPGMVPEIFAPEIISIPDSNEYSLTFSSDSTEVFFYRIAPDWHCTLYTSKCEIGIWSTPSEAVFAIAYSASEPCFSYDNQRLYFIWSVLINREPVPNYYFVERNDTGWSEPVLAGQGMWLCYDSTGQLYTTDMSSYQSDGKTYLAKVNTENGVFTDYERINIQPYYGYQAHPCIAKDGSYMIFDVGGGEDLYVSFKKPDGTWGYGIRLSNHGFDVTAGGGYISPCGNYLFFHLNGDIWWVDIDVINNLNPSLGTNNLHNLNKINIYPNPANDKITIDCGDSQNLSMQVFNNVGQLVFTKEINNNKVDIFISWLPPGMYIIKLVGADWTVQKKIIKQ